MPFNDVTTDTIDVNRNKRGFIESVYRRYASAGRCSSRRRELKKKKEKEEKDLTEREGGTIEEPMKIVDRRETDRYGVFYFVI